jgi:hypothetical protein
VNSRDEMKGPRDLIARLQPGGGLTIKRDGLDVTNYERQNLDNEIRHLEKVLARSGAKENSV